MGPQNTDGLREERLDRRGRPLKGYLKMTVERKARIDVETDILLREKCRRIGCSIADGIREGIKLFIQDRRY